MKMRIELNEMDEEQTYTDLEQNGKKGSIKGRGLEMRICFLMLIVETWIYHEYFQIILRKIDIFMILRVQMILLNNSVILNAFEGKMGSLVGMDDQWYEYKRKVIEFENYQSLWYFILFL